MKVCVLHLSDLHRDASSGLTTSTLLTSLERDRDRYMESGAAIPALQSPSLIIVSGDLVYGVSPTCRDAEEQLAEQYSVAEEFLGELARSMLGGDRSKIVIVPGNHDVSYYHAARSMKELRVKWKSDSRLVELVDSLRSTDSRMRWSWRSLRFSEIIDTDLYNARLSAFCSFYDRFYGGDRRYHLNPATQYDLFDYPEVDISIAAFSSCFNNDPLNRRGAIHPECIAKAASDLRSERYRNRLTLGVWHHNTSGGPSDGDYMDADTLQSLIDMGVSIGFHGHQHKAEFVTERFRFGGDRKITVIGAGTLCGGPKSLRSGYRRGYNLLEIDRGALEGRVLRRVMKNDDFRLPIWGPDPETPAIVFKVERPIHRASLSEERLSLLARAESNVRTKQYDAAIDLLEPIREDSLARRLLLECYVAINNAEMVQQVFWPPESVSEIIAVADALWELKKIARLRELLDLKSVMESKDPTIVELRERLLLRIEL